MQIKQKKWVVVLLIVALVINLVGWIGFASAVCLSGDYIILPIICFVISFLIGVPILVYIISSKIALMLKEK